MKLCHNFILAKLHLTESCYKYKEGIIPASVQEFRNRDVLWDCNKQIKKCCFHNELQFVITQIIKLRNCFAWYKYEKMLCIALNKIMLADSDAVVS